MIRQLCFHRRGDSQRLMHAAEVVVHVVERDGRDVIVELFGERLGQARKAAIAHANRQILPFHIRRADVLRVRVASDHLRFEAKADAGAVATGQRFVAVNLDQHRVIDFAAGERVIDGRQIGGVAVRRQLHAVPQARPHIGHKSEGRIGFAAADGKGTNQLRICINRDTRPDIACVPLRQQFGRHILLLGHKRPDFVALNPFACQVSDVRVQIVCARRAQLQGQLLDGVFGDSRHANGGPDGVAFDQGRYDLSALGGVQSIRNGPII